MNSRRTSYKNELLIFSLSCTCGLCVIHCCQSHVQTPLRTHTNPHFLATTGMLDNIVLAGSLLCPGLVVLVVGDLCHRDVGLECFSKLVS